MEPDDSHQLVGLGRLLGDDAHLLSKGLSELLVGDGDGLLELALQDGLIQELSEGLGDAALHQLRNRLEGVGGVLELVEAFQLDPTSGNCVQLLDIGVVVEVLENVVDFRQLLFVVAAEQRIAGWRLKQDQHCFINIVDR